MPEAGGSNENVNSINVEVQSLNQNDLGSGEWTSYTSYTSYTSDSTGTYGHLIETQYLLHLDRKVYRCKECPDASDY